MTWGFILRIRRSLKTNAQNYVNGSGGVFYSYSDSVNIQPEATQVPSFHMHNGIKCQ